MINKITEIAHIAGGVIREGFRKNISVEFKTNESNLVTEIDKRSEAMIIDFIKKEFPSHSILAEESGITNPGSEYEWIVDPLDGTTNFVHGLPIFAVSISVQKTHRVLYGVVYDVMNDITYSAEVGAGAYRDGEKIVVSNEDNLKRSVLAAGFPYNISDNPEKTIERFASFIRKARAVRRLGSAALDLCRVAEGVFAGYWEVFLKPWDIGAGKLLVEEAGGLVTDFKGDKTDIFSHFILASNGKIHNEMLRILNNG